MIESCPKCGSPADLQQYCGIAINGWAVECDRDNEMGDGSHGSGLFPTPHEALVEWRALCANQAWLDARDAEFDDRWNARMNP